MVNEGVSHATHPGEDKSLSERMIISETRPLADRNIGAVVAAEMRLPQASEALIADAAPQET